MDAILSGAIEDKEVALVPLSFVNPADEVAPDEPEEEPSPSAPDKPNAAAPRASRDDDEVFQLAGALAGAVGAVGAAGEGVAAGALEDPPSPPLM